MNINEYFDKKHNIKLTFNELFILYQALAISQVYFNKKKYPEIEEQHRKLYNKIENKIYELNNNVTNR